MKAVYVLPLTLLAVVASFAIGLQTAGDVRTIQLSSATDNIHAGDMNADGSVDINDVTIILEVSQGYRTASVAELEADPNGNGELTVDDALRVLRTLSSRS